MYIIGYFIISVAHIVKILLSFYKWIIIARAVLSWVNPDPYNPIVRFIHTITDPVLIFLRRRLPLVYGGMDFSPILALLAIVLLESFLVGSLYRLGSSLL
ncbi:MAG: hypothetical protein CSB33_01240 [Desulfobacterales bacterium]|nr:MAG: hypothetical protein CSB33_01240 [Desulfobacterales bacterium]